MTFFKNFFILFIMCMIVLIGCDRLQMLTEEEFDALVDSGGDGGGDEGPKEWQVVGDIIVSGWPNNISLVTNNNIPHIAFSYISGANSYVYAYIYNGNNFVPIGATPIHQTGDMTLLGNVDLKFYDNKPYVAYVINNGGNQTAYMKYYNGSIWTNDMYDFITMVSGNRVSLEVKGAGSIYVALVSGANMFSVYKFIGDSWGIQESALSGDTFDLGGVYNSNPYIGYIDDFNINPKVSYFNGSVWSPLTNPTANTSSHLSFMLDSGGTPYIAYFDTATTQLVVKKHTGSWQNVGSAITTNNVDDIVLYLDGATPYIAYSQSMNKFTIKKFNGSDWEILGETQIVDDIDYISFVVDSSTHTPCFAYYDGMTSKIKVYKYDTIK